MLNLMSVMDAHVKVNDASFLSGNSKDYSQNLNSNTENSAFSKIFLKAVESSKKDDTDFSPKKITNNEDKSDFAVEGEKLALSDKEEAAQKSIVEVIRKYVNPNQDGGDNQEEKKKGSIELSKDDIKKMASEMVEKLEKEGFTPQEAARIVEKIFSKLHIAIKIEVKESLAGKLQIKVDFKTPEEKMSGTKLKTLEKVFAAVDNVFKVLLQNSSLSENERDKFLSLVKNLREKMIELLDNSEDEGKEKRLVLKLEKLLDDFSPVLKQKGFDISLDKKNTGVLASFLKDIKKWMEDAETPEKGKESSSEVITTALKLTNTIVKLMGNKESKKVELNPQEIQKLAQLLNSKLKIDFSPFKDRVNAKNKESLKENALDEVKDLILSSLDTGKIEQLQLKGEKTLEVSEKLAREDGITLKTDSSKGEKIQLHTGQLEQVVEFLSRELEKDNTQIKIDTTELKPKILKKLSEVKVEVETPKGKIIIPLAELMEQSKLEFLAEKTLTTVSNKLAERKTTAEIPLSFKSEKVVFSFDLEKFKSLVSESVEEVEINSKPKFNPLFLEGNDQLVELNESIRKKKVFFTAFKDSNVKSDAKPKENLGKAFSSKVTKKATPEEVDFEKLKKKYNLKEETSVVNQKAEKQAEKLSSSTKEVGNKKVVELKKFKEKIVSSQKIKSDGEEKITIGTKDITGDFVNSNNKMSVSVDQQIVKTQEWNLGGDASAKVPANTSKTLLEKRTFLEQLKENFTKTLESFSENTIQLEKNTLRIKLHPKSLGELTIELKKEESGISAKVVYTNSEVKALLDQALDGVKTALAQKGVNLHNYQVVSSKEDNNGYFSEQQGSQQEREFSGEQQGRERRERGKRHNEEFSFDEEGSSEEAGKTISEMMQTIRVRSGRVDYWI